MRLRTIVSTAALMLSLASPLLSRPYAITRMVNVTAHFDNGECGYVYTGIPHAGAIESFWRPDLLGGVYTWGFTQGGREYDFIPAPCAVGGI